MAATMTTTMVMTMMMAMMMTMAHPHRLLAGRCGCAVFLCGGCRCYCWGPLLLLLLLLLLLGCAQQQRQHCGQLHPQQCSHHQPWH